VALSTSVPIATPARPVARAHAAGRIPRPLASVRFDWAIVVASGWFIGGVYLDGWAHNTFPSLETFFTPWHAVMYSGFLAMMAVLGWAMGRNHVAGRSWWDAIPAGYELSLVGGLLFLAGGVGDMLWHFAFGIEADLEALLSPTHLLLLLGGALLLTGPVPTYADVPRILSRRAGPPNCRAFWRSPTCWPRSPSSRSTPTYGAVRGSYPRISR
jgi:hypothetical protein